MGRLWVLALKEVKVAFRDTGLIVTMLVTPLVLTLAIAAAFGGSGGSSTLSDIPVLLLDKDQGSFAQSFIDIFYLDEVDELIALEMVADEATARARVEADEVAALVIIPEDFSSRVFPFIKSVESALGIDLLSLTGEEIAALPEAQKQQIGMLYATSMVLPEQNKETAVVEVYGSPDWRISVSVVKSVVTQGIEQMLMTTEGVMAIMEKVFGAQFAGGDMSTNSAGMQDAFEGMEMDSTEMNQSLPISVNVVSPTGRGFNWLDYSATSQAILFLMFAVTSGGRTLLAEREYGTLPRLLVTPNSSVVILVGKMAGIVITGLMQVFLLWGATALIGAWWGPPVAVVVTTIALVLFASGVGALISAWAKTPFQAGSLGSVFSLVAAAISGTFMPRSGLPGWLQSASLITPNAWGIELFSALQTGHDLVYILPSLGWVLLLTVVYYGVAAVGFQRQFR